MQSKEKNEKRDVPKKSDFSADKLSEVTGYSKFTVKAYRRGDLSPESPAGNKIGLGETLLHEGENALLEAVKKVLKPL